jgi:hypothetical protein
MGEADKPLSLGAINPADRPLIDVFERAYRLKPVTRSVQKALDKVQKQIDEFYLADDADGEQFAALVATALDELLAPEGNNRTRAKTLILEKWKADELAIDELRRFFDDVQERAVARPT